MDFMIAAAIAAILNIGLLGAIIVIYAQNARLIKSYFTYGLITVASSFGPKHCNCHILVQPVFCWTRNKKHCRCGRAIPVCNKLGANNRLVSIGLDKQQMN